MLQDLSIVNCISRIQVELLTFVLLVLGQRFIRRTYFQKGKYSQNLSQTTQQNDLENLQVDSQDESVDTAQESFSEISNTQTIRIMNKFVKLGKIDLAEQVFFKLRDPCIQAYTIMIKGYSKINQLEKSTQIIEKMQQKGMQPTIVTYNTYLTCALKCKNLEIADQVMVEMQNKDVVTYSTYIRGLLRMNKIDQAMQTHELVLQQNVILDEMYFDVLINGLIKSKQIKKAKFVYDQMKQQNFEFNDFSVSVIIQLLSKFDQQQIIDYFRGFQKKDVALFNRIIYQMLNQPQTVLIGCEFLKESINTKVMLKKTIYEKTIEVLYQVITHQIIKDGLSVKYAQDTLLLVVKYAQMKKIQLNNQITSDISVKSCSQFYNTSQKNLNNNKLYGRCLQI